jgi:MFS family permease
MYTLLPSLLGPLIISRRPRHSVGWLLYGVGLAFGSLFLLQELIIYTSFTAVGPVPGALYIAWVGSQLWIVPFALILVTVAMFPDGHIPARRWRWVLWLILIFAVTMLVSEVFEQPMTSAYNLDNPFTAPPEWDRASPILFSIAVSGLLLAVLGVSVLTIVRFRNAHGAERQQWKWLAWSLLVSVVLIVAGVILTFIFQSTLGEAMISWSLGFPVLSIGIAVLRYRLYDIDVIINRTLVYTMLTLTLALLYIGSIVLLQNVFRVLIGQSSDLAIVVSTLSIAAVFTPLRRRIQTFIDHRFYRRKYDAEQVLATFSATLRDETDLDHLAVTILGVADTTMQPAHLSLWLRADAPSAKAARQPAMPATQDASSRVSLQAGQ